MELAKTKINNIMLHKPENCADPAVGCTRAEQHLWWGDPRQEHARGRLVDERLPLGVAGAQEGPVGSHPELAVAAGCARRNLAVAQVTGC